MAVRGLRPDHSSYEAMNNAYERALVSMHKMPRIWVDYLELLLEQKWVTRTRRVFDRALAALPITQHDRIWQLYLVSGARWLGGAVWCAGAGLWQVVMLR
jgi:pre-mRNA-splicing factor SYF1